MLLMELEKGLVVNFFSFIFKEEISITRGFSISREFLEASPIFEFLLSNSRNFQFSKFEEDTNSSISQTSKYF